MNKLLFKLLRISGLPILFRELFQKNKVTIVLFHDISKETAEQTFSYLSSKYNIICLNTFIDAIEKKDLSNIPKKAMIITFDDGHIRNYEILPVIKKYNIPVTIFLCASIINTNRHFWFKYPKKSISTPELKLQRNSERLSILSKDGYEQHMEFEEPQALQKDHIEQMKPFINLQAHTMYHPILPNCSDAEAKTEIFEAKEVLENEFGLHINAISYPNGDYSEREIIMAKDAGYKCGITVDYGFNTINSDIFRLKRISFNDTEDMNELVVKASGLWAFLKTGFKPRRRSNN